MFRHRVHIVGIITVLRLLGRETDAAARYALRPRQLGHNWDSTPEVSMQFRTLGRSSLRVAPLCLGGNVFGWTADEAASFAVLDASVNAGLNFIDTADVYSRWVPGHKGGESETIIGNWLKSSGKRDKVIIATKVGKPMEGEKGLSRKHITKAIEASLKRLQTDYIDLYQSHDDDKETPLLETLETFTELIKQGKVR